jgi:hypothetical protein
MGHLACFRDSFTFYLCHWSRRLYLQCLIRHQSRSTLSNCLHLLQHFLHNEVDIIPLLMLFIIVSLLIHVTMFWQLHKLVTVEGRHNCGRTEKNVEGNNRVPFFSTHSNIFLDEYRKTTRNFSWDSRPLCRDLNTQAHKYKQECKPLLRRRTYNVNT